MLERLWFKIGEAADQAGVTPREIRYWEKIIPELRPRRSKGNQRHYHRDDLPMLRCVAAWVKDGFTVADCRELLAKGSITRDLGLDIEEPEHKATEEETVSEAVTDIMQGIPAPAMSAEPPPHLIESLKTQLAGITESLKGLLAILRKSDT